MELELYAVFEVVISKQTRKFLKGLNQSLHICVAESDPLRKIQNVKPASSVEIRVYCCLSKLLSWPLHCQCHCARYKICGIKSDPRLHVLQCYSQFCAISTCAVNDITVERRINLQNLHLTEADRVPVNYTEMETCETRSSNIKTSPL